MGKRLWTEVERYFDGLLLPADPVMDEVLKASSSAGLSPINVTPSQGRLLWILARVQSSRRILEIGTLGGYSAIWLARALPAGGRLITLEADPKAAKVARANVKLAGLAHVVEVRLGAALDTLPKLEAGGERPFDLTFIDADKPNNPEYFEWALKLSRPGGLIVVDNVVREGEVVDRASRDPSVLGVRRLAELLHEEGRVSATTIQTVGSKGYDGFTIALVAGDGT
ncbi:MAG: O-methyltransferase [Thaumarchaeota archaeon]|nr:O-methyltransferase [Nitrososphaerota archaeon]